MTSSHFWGNFKNGPFWTKLTQMWPKFGALMHGCSTFFNFFSQIRKKNVSGEKIHFFHNDPLTTPLSLHLDKF